mgnify:CR=1 FL=1
MLAVPGAHNVSNALAALAAAQFAEVPLADAAEAREKLAELTWGQMADAALILVGTVDAASVHSTAHAGAVYLHRGETWVVDELDLEERVAVLTRRVIERDH